MKSQQTMIRPRWSRYAAPAIVLLAAAVAVAPQLLRGNSCGYDFDFHLVSWLDCLNSWRHGILYPHWTASANFGAGEPRFVFYPPLTWMLGAALGFVLPWTLVPAALSFLLLVGTGVATRALARQALPEGAATLAGCAAIFSGYALHSVYERAAFAELAGGLWIPLLLLFSLRDRMPNGPVRKRVFDSSALPLALVIAGCWLSNVPVGVMASYLLVAVAVALAVLSKSWAPVLRAAVAAALGTGLTAFFLLPAAWQQRWVDVSQITDDPGEKIENNWLFARNASPALGLHDVELHRVSLIAISMIAVALGGLLICWFCGKLKAKNNSIPRRWWVPLALIPLAVLLLQFPLSLPVWSLLPKLRFLQFPWRWLLVLEAPMAIFFSLAVWPGDSLRRWRRMGVVAICAASFLAATAFTARNFFQVCYSEDTVAGMMRIYQSGAGFLGTWEYAPPGADNTRLATGLPAACLVADAGTELGVMPPGVQSEDTSPAWDAAQGSCEVILNWQFDQPEHKRLSAIVAHPGTLILRLRSYPAWRVMVNGRPAGKLPRRDDDLVAVPLPQGPVELTVDWTTTPDVLAGRLFSALAVLVLTGLWFFERKQTQPPV